MLSEVDWTLDEGDGRKLVCINLEKRLPVCSLDAYPPVHVLSTYHVRLMHLDRK